MSGYGWACFAAALAWMAASFTFAWYQAKDAFERMKDMDL